MSDRYDPKNIEKKWQGIWEQKETFKVTEESAKKKFYLLEMFPYPSGKIHMGHVRNYSIGDVLARFLNMKGYNCLHPMGWDSFGLPAENAAIQNNVLPATWTHSNITNMKRQLKGLGFNYDWSREVTTCNPEYYKWNQWLFLKMFERGLAYKKRSSVNWCPGCSTVLANEQVDGGLCWRCESEVEERNLDQWFLKITDYADELLEYCDRLTGWPERVLVMQRNWIGKSIGAEVAFPLAGSHTAGTSAAVFNKTIKVFTTRPDTLYGATFMSLAPEHPMVESLIQGKEQETEVRGFIEKVKKQGRQEMTTATMEKEGVFTGSYCINPLTGKKMPIYVANFVLMGYGTGAVMAVPAHDQRDFEFAKKYDLPKVVVINPNNDFLEPKAMEEAYEGDGIMVNSGPFNGMNNRDAMPKIVDHLEEKANGKGATTYRLRDWGISRQRYWGCPIPIIYCDTCGKVPVPDEDLPVMLPKDIKLSGKGGSPLEEAEEFINTKCPKCGNSARRETDTMDTFVDSSWYFLRYASPKETEVPFDKGASEYWMPVDQYIGGIEHAVMHLLYARFFTKVLRDIGLINIDEPFKNLLTQGMVCKGTLKCPKHGYRAPEDVEDGRCKDCNAELENGPVEKMSKSKKNTVDPDKIIEKYGADTTRLFSLFAAPPQRDLEWNEDGVEGSYRFLCRVWRLVSENIHCIQAIEPYNGSRPLALNEYLRDTHRMTHRTIKRVTGDIEHRFHFNTAISAIMELVNALYQWEGDKRDELECSVLKEAIETIIILLLPFAPHICEELWVRLGKKGLLSTSKWPSYSEEALKVKETLVVVQINGKLRTKICVSVNATQQEVEDMALTDDKIIDRTQDKEIKKVIYVPNRLVNIVVK